MKVTPAQLRALKRRDPRLGSYIERVDRFPNFPAGDYKRLTHFESLARSITYQQLSGKAAGTIWKRVCALGDSRGFPKPAELLDMEEEVLRGAGLSHNKWLALRDLAERHLDGRLSLRSVARRPDEEVIDELVAVRGIGVWTAQMFLMFKLGRLDVMAPGDLGLQEGMKRLDELGERPTPKELEARAQDWAPLRSVASWTLWRLLELED